VIERKYRIVSGPVGSDREALPTIFKCSVVFLNRSEQIEDLVHAEHENQEFQAAYRSKRGR
jgi:hypothetical protein